MNPTLPIDHTSTGRNCSSGAFGVGPSQEPTARLSSVSSPVEDGVDTVLISRRRISDPATAKARTTLP
jgi:hypothetical protein